jgi:hypothetical protein
MRMPPRRQPKAWLQLRAALQQEAAAKTEQIQLIRLQQLREVHQEINRLEAMGPNEGRAKQIRLLRRRLSKL